MSDSKGVTLDGATEKELGEAMVAAFKKEWPNISDFGGLVVEFGPSKEKGIAYELRAKLDFVAVVYVPENTLAQNTLEDKTDEARSLGSAMRDVIAQISSE